MSGGPGARPGTATRPAPAAARAIEVLNFLAARPQESFTLSEVARGIGLNVASASAVLRALTDADYVHRHPAHKTYALGPAVVALGNAALARHRAVDVARDEMRALAEEAGSECVASVVVGDEIVIVALAGRPPASSADVRVGQRVPMLPPLGPVFVSWADPAAIERWLAGLGPAVEPAEHDHYRRALDSVRRRGFSVGLESGARARMGQALLELVGAPRDDHRRREVEGLVAALRHDYEVLDLDPPPPDGWHLSNVAAPVFGPDGQVVLALTLHGFAGPVGPDRLAAVADRLVSAASLVTRTIGGHAPARPEPAHSGR